MTEGEFAELQRRAAENIAREADIEAWVDAVLAGEPKEST